MKDTKIEWAHDTFNFWWGCNKVSAECTNCYIGPVMSRFGHEPFSGPIRTKNWKTPMSLNNKAMREGTRRRVFTCSMSDFFHEGADDWREEAWNIIRGCQMLDWLILTKRPENIKTRLPEDWGSGWPNVWLGVTAGVNSSLYRIDTLREIPAAVRFLSAEPLLEDLDLGQRAMKLHWIIAGGESGPGRRESKVGWYIRLYETADQFGIPFFMKQDTGSKSGDRGRIPDALWEVKEFPDTTS